MLGIPDIFKMAGMGGLGGHPNVEVRFSQR